MEFKGTPGPWSIGYYGDGDGIFIAGTYGGPDPTYICSVRPDLRSSQSESNANLIAAAPDLLEALQDMVALVKSRAYPQPDKPLSDWGCAEAAEQIIKQALGEE